MPSLLIPRAPGRKPVRGGHLSSSSYLVAALLSVKSNISNNDWLSPLDISCTTRNECLPPAQAAAAADVQVATNSPQATVAGRQAESGLSSSRSLKWISIDSSSKCIDLQAIVPDRIPITSTGKVSSALHSRMLIRPHGIFPIHPLLKRMSSSWRMIDKLEKISLLRSVNEIIKESQRSACDTDKPSHLALRVSHSIARSLKPKWMDTCLLDSFFHDECRSLDAIRALSNARVPLDRLKPVHKQNGAISISLFHRY